MSNRLWGCDLSHHNGILTHCNFDFAICKATEGNSFIDNQFANSIRTLQKNKKLYGAYHFLTPFSSASTQINHFLNTIDKSYVPGNGIVAVDYEHKDLLADRQHKLLDATVRILCNEGFSPFIYISDGYIDDALRNLADHYDVPLWIARYYNLNGITLDYRNDNYPKAAEEKNTSNLIRPVRKSSGIHAIRQFTSKGLLGVTTGKGTLDLDVAYMTPEAWLKYARVSGGRHE